MKMKRILIHLGIIGLFSLTSIFPTLASQPKYQAIANSINSDCSDGGSPYYLTFSYKPTLQTVDFNKCSAIAIFDPQGNRYGGESFAFYSVVIKRLPDDKADGDNDNDDGKNNNNNNNSDGKNNNNNNNNNNPPPTPTPSTPPPTPDPKPTPTPTPPPTPTPTPSTPPPTPTPSKEADACAILHPETETPSTLIQAANLLASILPQTPDNMRLPTLISEMGGQGSLAGNLGLEIYSAAWQYFGIIAFIKFYKLIPGKMS